MIKTETCITIWCDDCKAQFTHEWTPHYPEGKVREAREETTESEWWTDDDKLDLCWQCRVKPHPFRLMPNTTDECWRCANPFEEHEVQAVRDAS